MLGGGTFIGENKVLPGSYINFVSASKASAALSERGIAAIGLVLKWGIDGAVFAVEADEFLKDSMKIFGYAYTASELKGLRDLFKNIKKAYFYKLNTGGVKATCTFADAKYKGVRGNDLKIVIEHNEAYTAEAPLYDVSTFLGTMLVDTQTVVTMAGLVANDYVTFKSGASIEVTAGTSLADGTDGAVQDGTYQTFLDAIESYSFNALGCLSTSDTIKALYSNFAKRMRDEVGVKFQCVVFKYVTPDHEGIISVENGLVGSLADPSAVYWVLGAEAGCAINKSNMNRIYDGEFSIDTAYTQAQLEAGINAGKFMFHNVNGQVRVLEDINTFVSFTDEKSSDFANNQSIRVLDQIGTDIAVIFNSKYLGKIPNNASGRISFWNDIVKHHQDMQKLQAIEDFSPEDITVAAGSTKKAVAVSDKVTPTNAMGQLYMTVVVQ
jgi:hypothetical protein